MKVEWTKESRVIMVVDVCAFSCRKHVRTMVVYFIVVYYIM